MVKVSHSEISNNITDTFPDKYFALRDEVDSLCIKLEAVYKDHINCIPGCHQCCMDFRIFPVEFYSIQTEIRGKKLKHSREIAGDECMFLIEGLCSIYHSRPIICRTHGLPILFMGEEEWQLSYCELNFTGRNIPDFNESNTFPQDRFNSRLFMLNREFIKSLPGVPYSESDLLNLKDIFLP